MATSRRLRAIARWAVTVGFVAALAAPGPATAAGSALPIPLPGAGSGSALAAWHGGVDLYRAGTFTTQKSWLWCTAAGVQIVDNIVDHRQDHSAAGQRRYFNWMRTHNRYRLPVSAGVDPAGWTAGLRHFVDARYRLVASRTFDDALRSAVTNMRKTNLPVAITVSHGGHGWILAGFRATADPAKTTAFTVTSVRVVGPLYGLQSKNGYDMPPNTKLTPAQLKRFFTAWKYAPKPMIWDGRYVSIQPIPAKTPAKAPAKSPVKSPAATHAPPPTPSAIPTVLAVPAVEPTTTPSPGPSTTSSPAPLTGLLEAGPPGTPAGDTGATGPPASAGTPDTSGLVPIAVLALLVVAMAAFGARVRRRG